MQPHELIVSLEELSRQLRLSQRWLRKEATERRIPFLQAGQRRLFNVDAVRKALAHRAASKGGAK